MPRTAGERDLRALPPLRDPHPQRRVRRLCRERRTSMRSRAHRRVLDPQQWWRASRRRRARDCVDRGFRSVVVETVRRPGNLVGGLPDPAWGVRRTLHVAAEGPGSRAASRRLSQSKSWAWTLGGRDVPTTIRQTKGRPLATANGLRSPSLRRTHLRHIACAVANRISRRARAHPDYGGSAMHEPGGGPQRPQAHDVENGLVRGQEAAATSAIAAISAGPTRQQPPTSCAPALIQLRTSLGSKAPAPAHAWEAWSQASPRFG